MLYESTGCGAVLPPENCCQRDSGLSLSRESCAGPMKNEIKTIDRKDLLITRNRDRVLLNRYHLPSFSINSPTEDCNGTQSTCASQHSLDFHLRPSTTKIVANVIKETHDSDFATTPKIDRLSSPDCISRVRHHPMINNTYATATLNKQFDTSLTSSGISLLSNSSSLWSTSTQVGHNRTAILM